MSNPSHGQAAGSEAGFSCHSHALADRAAADRHDTPGQEGLEVVLEGVHPGASSQGSRTTGVLLSRCFDEAPGLCRERELRAMEMQGGAEGREPGRMKCIIASDLHVPKCSQPYMDGMFTGLTAGPVPGTLILAGDPSHAWPARHRFGGLCEMGFGGARICRACDRHGSTGC